MEKFLNTLLQIVLYIWQLPQNIVGLITWAIMKGNESFSEDYKGEKLLFSERMSGGISLGKYIILMKRYYTNNLETNDTVNHEYGHSRQSLYLGPLYLIIVGIPSIIWAGLYGNVIPYTHNGYYKFYTESWADKLGGVERK